MPEICRESGKQPLYIGILSIPFGQPMNGEGVPQVVNSWLVCRYLVTNHTGKLTQANETRIDHPEVNGFAVLRLKQRLIVLIFSPK